MLVAELHVRLRKHMPGHSGGAALLSPKPNAETTESLVAGAVGEPATSGGTTPRIG
jgi:hypothetical protein